jgi:surface antigen
MFGASWQSNGAQMQQVILFSWRNRATVILFTILLGFAFLVPPALADPPPWAPAHGYRAMKGHGAQKHKQKHKKRHRQQSRATYELPPGLRNGRCRPELFDPRVVGGVIGAATGGYVGSKIGKGDGKLAATAIGTLVGAVVGHAVGEQLAQAENTCFSQTFEHVPDSETIVWRDSRRDAEYRVTPQRTMKTAAGEYCREYTAKATVGDKPVTRYGTACRKPDGSWKLIN